MFAQPTVGSLLPLTLSNADVIMPVCYTRALAFYAVPVVDETAIDRVQSGFYQLIALFPVAAGTLKATGGGNFEIVASPKGAVLSVQSAMEVSFAELQGGGFRNGSIPAVLSVPSYLPEDGAPLVHGHVTTVTGGIVVSLTAHHFLCDGPAAFNMFLAWGDLCRVGKLDRASAPVFDRSSMVPDGSGVTRAHAEYRVESLPPATAAPVTAPTDTGADTGTGSCKAGGSGALSSVPPEGPQLEGDAPAAAVAPPVPVAMPSLETEYLHFTASALEQLKVDATASLPGNDGNAVSASAWVSTNDALVALVWRGYMRARQAPPTTLTGCGFACDCRPRVSPSLPPGYFGNANFFPFAQLPAERLLSAPLGEVALEVRNATQRVDAEHVRSALNFIESVEDKSRVKASFLAYLGNDVCLTNWSKFPMFSIEFGWGPPQAVRVPNAKFDGFGIILASLDGGVDVMAGLESSHWERLGRDTEFTKYTDMAPFTARKQCATAVSSS